MDEFCEYPDRRHNVLTDLALDPSSMSSSTSISTSGEPRRTSPRLSSREIVLLDAARTALASIRSTVARYGCCPASHSSSRIPRCS